VIFPLNFYFCFCVLKGRPRRLRTRTPSALWTCSAWPLPPLALAAALPSPPRPPPTRRRGPPLTCLSSPAAGLSSSSSKGRGERRPRLCSTSPASAASTRRVRDHSFYTHVFLVSLVTCFYLDKPKLADFLSLRYSWANAGLWCIRTVSLLFMRIRILLLIKMMQIICDHWSILDPFTAPC
jgi:hypothetical protein